MHAQMHPEFAKTQVNPQSYDDEFETASKKVKKWSRVNNKVMKTLIHMNDVEQKTFNEIADFIEKKL